MTGPARFSIRVRLASTMVSEAADAAQVEHASGEQRSGIDQINSAVTQMDCVTQHNAALVEETAAAHFLLPAQLAAARSHTGSTT